VCVWLYVFFKLFLIGCVFKCTSNGIQYHQIEGSGPCIKILEMFFSGFPSIVGLQYFPHLTKLVIVGQTLDCMQNLEYCPELKELWICETKLKVGKSYATKHDVFVGFFIVGLMNNRLLLTTSRKSVVWRKIRD